MFSFGDIVYFDKLYFSDNKKDKKHNRPCTVLAEFKYKDSQYLYLAPLTTSIRQFNKRKGSYIMLSDPIYNSKISFVKIEDLIIQKAKYAHETGIKISEVDKNFLKIAINKRVDDSFYYEHIFNMIKMEETIQKLNEQKQQNPSDKPKRLLFQNKVTNK